MSDQPSLIHDPVGERADNSSNTDSKSTNAIVDNIHRRVGDVLRERIDAGSRLSIVSAYFTIYAFAALRDALAQVSRTRFLYGEPRGVGAVDPSAEDVKAFRLTDDGGIELQRVLSQKPLARACAEWIEQHVDIRTITQANFLHGKLYHVAGGDGTSAAIVGSSNFTRRGLGYGATPNVELNLDVRTDVDRDSLLTWFDDLWDDETRTRDAKQQVLAALQRIGRPYAPQFVYYKTLFHVFEDWLAEHGARAGLLHDVHLYDTAIWDRLYEFQKDGATSAINRLLRHNGCIVADSVGLGKTWTALAVIKFFELRNERVLVLCPKRLQDNWLRYASWAGWANNPFAKDRFNYTVLAHTDLSRYTGRAGSIDLANFNWGAFDLVVIDESHNFRNEGRDRTDDAGEIVRRSRYNRLLEEVLKDRVRSKVLMLSATPVNTSLRDLRNQIYLMTERRHDAFREALGIGDLQSLFGVAQREFQQWEQRRRAGGKADKHALIARLGADFLALLDAITIARSRTHIRRYYPQVHEEIGGFPKRGRPVNLHPESDLQGELSYDNLHDRIGAFRLAVYNPSRYLKDTSALDKEKEMYRFDQRDRERWLIGMMRVNLLKRLESSVHSFALSMGRVLEKMEDLDRRICAWLASPRVERDSQVELLPDEDEEDEDFAVGRSRRYRLAELDVERWRHDLGEDWKNFASLYAMAQRVTVARDAKLAELRRILAEKIAQPTEDKDGRHNRKSLVFTTFADTARYLYDHLADTMAGAHVALVTGGDGNRSSEGLAGFDDIVQGFAPRAQERAGAGKEVDVLIATDCLSEGQNLQDCDLVVNYDIHWNPVRLMQRFGRIDRLGSRNTQVSMTNFWPTRDLDRYLDLKNRVEARMALADATATGLDDPLAGDPEPGGDHGEPVQGELAFRDEQLMRLRDEILDIEQTEDGVTMSDLTLDDFIADLLQYVQQNRAALEEAPTGIHAVVDTQSEPQATLFGPPVRPGVIFCLKQRTASSTATPNLLQPYYLVHVRSNGRVRYSFRQAGQCLTLFRELAAGRSQPSAALEAAFDGETAQGHHMKRYEGLLAAALRDIAATFRSTQRRALTRQRGAKLAPRTERPDDACDFELVTWLVVANQQRSVHTEAVSDG